MRGSPLTCFKPVTNLQHLFIWGSCLGTKHLGLNRWLICTFLPSGVLEACWSTKRSAKSGLLAFYWKDLTSFIMWHAHELDDMLRKKKKKKNQTFFSESFLLQFSFSFRCIRFSDHFHVVCFLPPHLSDVKPCSYRWQMYITQAFVVKLQWGSVIL